jgi:CarD family transcriptional regulator
MFNVGDKIVYPMHGAGVIEAIEEKEILGKKQSYYVLRMPIGDMKVLLPTKNAEGIGVREVIGVESVSKVLEVLKEHKRDTNCNWNKRYRENMIKIKTGDIYEVADVVSSLMAREKEKGLSTGERKMLNNAKQILISELVLAQNADRSEVEDVIEEFLAK